LSALNIPLSASDLQEIGKALDPLETNEYITENPVVGRIEVIRPDGDADDVCGYFVREGDIGKGEAWFGFRQVSI
jgi:hypothetical protein